jgi:glutaredoxin-like protein NrdH
MNIDALPYVNVEGSGKDLGIVVYALSTCGFCKRALRFLDEKGIAYKYIYVDQIPFETKTELKLMLKDTFKENVAFPFTVFSDGSHLIGFIEPDWVRTLGL